MGSLLRILGLLVLATLPVSGYGVAWEQSADAGYLRSGDLKAFKQVIQNDKENKYKDPQLIIEALSTGITSGNVELIQYLASLGWLDECRKVEYCKPVHFAAAWGGCVSLRTGRRSGSEKRKEADCVRRGKIHVQRTIARRDQERGRPQARRCRQGDRISGKWAVQEEVIVTPNLRRLSCRTR